MARGTAVRKSAGTLHLIIITCTSYNPKITDDNYEHIYILNGSPCGAVHVHMRAQERQKRHNSKAAPKLSELEEDLVSHFTSLGVPHCSHAPRALHVTCLLPACLPQAHLIRGSP